MSLHAETIMLHSTSNNPFEAARSTLIKALSRMSVPRPIGDIAESGDFFAVSDHLREAAALMDAWLSDIGHQVRDNSSAPLEMEVFDAAFSGAIEGNATWICEQAAAAVPAARRVA